MAKPEGKVLAVVGSRKFPNLEAVDQWVTDNCHRFDWLVTGGAKGVDKTAEEAWKRVKGSQNIKIYEAQWDRYKGYAGMIRNVKIIGEATFVACFWTSLSDGSLDDIGLVLACGKPMNLYVR